MVRNEDKEREVERGEDDGACGNMGQCYYLYDLYKYTSHAPENRYVRAPDAL